MSIPILGFIFAGFGLIALLASIFWLWMLIDCATNRGLSDTEKIVWVLIVLFTHFIGALLYFLIARPKRSGLI